MKVKKLLELSDVTKIYGNGALGLRDVNLKINKGDFAFIVGSSGSGKSTLIKLLLKEIEPTSGKLYVKERDITYLKRKYVPYLRRKIGVVFQDFRLLNNKTVYENIEFAMKVVEAKPREMRRNIPKVISMVGLESKAQCYPGELSGGEKQRVVLARAMVNNPAILLADEPTGNLDPKTSWEIMQILEDINHKGTTVVVVTHDKELVDGMKKRVIKLQDGEIVRDVERGGYTHEH